MIDFIDSLVTTGLSTQQNPLFVSLPLQSGKTTYVGEFAFKHPNKKIVFFSWNVEYSNKAVNYLSEQFNLSNLFASYKNDEVDYVFIEYPKTFEQIENLARIYTKAQFIVFIPTKSMMS